MEENIVIDGHNITYMYRKGKLDYTFWIWSY